MLDTHFVGEITERLVALEFLKLGILISKPIVQSSRYDFIAEINNHLYKIQVKTCRLKENAYLSFATSTSHTNGKGTKNISYTKKDVDYFATIYQGQCYLIPIEDCAKREARIRLIPPKNGQKTGIRYAKDYQLQDMIKKI